MYAGKGLDMQYSKSPATMKGMSLLGGLCLMMFIIFSVMIGMNIIPPYLRFYEVKDSLESLAKEPELKNMNKAKIRDLFERRLQVNSIKDVKAENLDVQKNDDKLSLILDYEVRVHLIGNMDALIKFNKEELVQ